MYSELECVNQMLSTVNLAPVSSLDNLVGDVKWAYEQLLATKKNVLTEGFLFNTYPNTTLTPDRDHIINLPTDYLHFYDTQYKGRHIARGMKLLDTKKKTYHIDHPVTGILRVNLDIDVLPIVAVNYITAQASRVYYTNMIGDTAMIQVLTRMELDTYRALMELERGHGYYNIFDNYGAMLDRRPKVPVRHLIL